MDQAPSHSPRRRLIVGAILLTLGCLIGLIAVLVMAASRSSLPREITDRATFPVYYPKPLPHGYQYIKGSAQLENRLLSYKLENGPHIITITEQATPSNPPDLAHLPGFKSLDVPSAYAAIGKNMGQPVAIVLNPTTLITINSAGGVPPSAVSDCAKALRPR